MSAETDAGSQRLLHAVSDGIVQVRAGVLRQIIRSHRQLLELDVPHADSYRIGGAELERIVERDGLLVDTEGLADCVLLVAKPNAQQRAAIPLWVQELRLLAQCYHIRVHHVLEGVAERGQLQRERAKALLALLGDVAVREALSTLEADQQLLPPRTDLSGLIEILAATQTLRYFAPELVPFVFPAMNMDRIDEVCAELGVELKLVEVLGADGMAERERLRIAEESAQPAAAETVYLLAYERRACKQLAARLHQVCSAAGLAASAWERVLEECLRCGRSRRAVRRSRRMWRELERAVRAQEQLGVKVDLWPWLRSLGRKPLVKTLQQQGDVRMHQHLRRARRYAHALGLDGAASVLDQALANSAAHVRKLLFQPLCEVFDRVGLSSDGLVGRVASRSMVAALLDKIVDWGTIGFSDLRDQLSRSTQKMQDLGSFLQLFSGDALLRADRELARVLKGVYRPSTFYMRGLQRTSSLFFGTPAGRVITRFALLPVIVAAMSIGGLQFLLHELATVFGLSVPHFFRTDSVALASVVTLCLIEWLAFRSVAWRSVRAVGRSVWWLAWTAPKWLLQRAPIQRLLANYWIAMARRFVLKPAGVVALVYAGLRLAHGPELAWWGWGLAFVGASALLNARLVRRIQEVVGDAALAWWAQLTRRLFPELFRIVMDSSRRLLFLLERAAHAVDDMLRLRQYEGRLRVVVKAVAGKLWAAVMYGVQLVATLLVEPQLNPIKHFPVVTVSHKLLLPFGPSLGTVIGPAVAGPIVLLAPGFFGFLVWELSSNWRLYSASRPKLLRPCIVSSHGEDMARLLQPGFHSGTVPKLYRRLRRQGWSAWQRGERWVAGKRGERLAQVVLDMERFWARHAIDLLATEVTDVQIGESVLTTSTITVELVWQGRALVVVCEAGGAELIGRVVQCTWELTESQRACVADVLAGMFMLLGVSWVEDGSGRYPAACFGSIPYAAWVERFHEDNARPSRSLFAGAWKNVLQPHALADV